MYEQCHNCQAPLMDHEDACTFCRSERPSAATDKRQKRSSFVGWLTLAITFVTLGLTLKPLYDDTVIYVPDGHSGVLTRLDDNGQLEMEMLPPGRHFLSPLDTAKVDIVEDVVIKPGEVGVLIRRGDKGVEADSLQPGRYQINPELFEVVEVPVGVHVLRMQVGGDVQVARQRWNGDEIKLADKDDIPAKLVIRWGGEIPPRDTDEGLPVRSTANAQDENGHRQ